MPKKPDLAEFIRARITSNKRARVFVREDFLDLGGYDQLGRALAKLVASGLLVRVGHGIYTKARLSILTGRPVPKNPILPVAFEALRKLGYRAAPSIAATDYRAGKTNQVPATEVINIGRQRITRTIGFDKVTVRYERTTSTGLARAIAPKRLTRGLYRRLADKYIWWDKKPEHDRLVTQVMSIGTLKDIFAIEKTLGKACLRKVLRQAGPGQIEDRSWGYWHYRLGLANDPTQIPAPPKRSVA